MIFGIKAVKFLLFIFNFIFAILGIAVLALGVFYKLQIESIVTYLGKEFPIAPDLFIAIGTISFVVSFFGCIGASRENRRMLIAFVILLVVLLIIELAVVIIAFVDISNTSLNKTIKQKITEDFEKGNLGLVELKIECCGVDGPESYQPEYIPFTCYKNRDNTTSANLFQIGCWEKISNHFHSVGTQLGAIAISVAVIEIIGALFALTLSSNIKNKDKK